MTRWIGVAAVAAALIGGKAGRAGTDAWKERRAGPKEALEFKLDDVASSLGLTFKHEVPELDLNGNTRILFSAPGAAVADFDGDGWMDVFVVNSKPGSRNHLYLNQGGKRFVESAQAWGVAEAGAAGASVTPVVLDYNDDGRPDVYVARLGCARLLENTGSAFKDVTAKSGVGDCRNGVGALPLDYDRDGKMDLYVLRFWPALDYFKLKTDHAYWENSANALNGGKNTLYRNRGDGTFEDVTDTAGGGDTHWSFDAQVADFIGDGIPRLYVANDFGQDTLYEIRDGKLIDVSGSLPMERRNGMDASLVDLDGDGVPALYVSNISQRQFVASDNFLWKFDENGQLVDRAQPQGLHNALWAWGAGVSDLDLDGKQDVYVANGYVTGKSEKAYSFPAMVLASLPGAMMSNKKLWPKIGDRSWSGNQVDCLFLNRGSHVLASKHAGVTQAWDSRAVALIDYDNNGAQDLLVTTMGGELHLFRNTTEPRRRWIGVSLVGGRGTTRDAAGSRVRVVRRKKAQYRWATAGHTGLMASSDPRLHFGLGVESDVDVEILWPSGRAELIEGLPSGRYYTFREGRGRPDDMARLGRVAR